MRQFLFKIRRNDNKCFEGRTQPFVIQKMNGRKSHYSQWPLCLYCFVDPNQIAIFSHRSFIALEEFCSHWLDWFYIFSSIRIRHLERYCFYLLYFKTVLRLIKSMLKISWLLEIKRFHIYSRRCI